jgi:Xaa-Pro aminopeptidase
VRARRGEVAAKLEAVRGWLDASRLGAVLLGSQPNFAWITAGGDSHISVDAPSGAGAVLVTSSNATILSTNIERPRLLDEEVRGLGFDAVDWPWHQAERARELLDALCDPSKSVSDIADLGLRHAGREFAPLRFTLTDAEVARYRRLGRDAAFAVEEACRSTRPGDSELDVAGRVADEAQRAGILALVNLVAADDRIARYRHPIPTDNRLRGTLLVALTGRRFGLHASLTRMMSFAPIDDDVEARHAAVVRVDARYLSSSTSGATLGAVVDAAIGEYAEVGYPDEWRLHHQGGLTGYAGREIFGRPGEAHALDANQAVAWNPSITRVKSEDTAIVGDAVPEVVTRTGDWPEVAAAGGGVLARPALLRADAD